jgi:hypothetical protein
VVQELKLNFPTQSSFLSTEMPSYGARLGLRPLPCYQREVKARFTKDLTPAVHYKREWPVFKERQQETNLQGKHSYRYKTVNFLNLYEHLIGQVLSQDFKAYNRVISLLLLNMKSCMHRSRREP